MGSLFFLNKIMIDNDHLPTGSKILYDSAVHGTGTGKKNKKSSKFRKKRWNPNNGN